MKLYYFPGACSLVVHIVLEWVGARYETVELDFESTKSPLYLAINPSGNVPLLTIGDFSLTENVAILSYLADMHPAARLIGDGTLRGRAEAMRWLAYLNSDVHGAFKPLFSPARFIPDMSFAGALANSARLQVRRHLERLDAQLEDRDWLAGSRSIADPYLFVMLRWAEGTKVGLRGLENVSRFLARMYADPHVRAALIAEEGRVVEIGLPSSELVQTLERSQSCVSL